MSIYLFAKEGSLISYPFTCICSLIYYTFSCFISLRLNFQSCNGMIEGLKRALGKDEYATEYGARLNQILSPPGGRGSCTEAQRSFRAFRPCPSQQHWDSFLFWTAAHNRARHLLWTLLSYLGWK
jgi:hypothetical protein